MTLEVFAGHGIVTKAAEVLEPREDVVQVVHEIATLIVRSPFRLVGETAEGKIAHAGSVLGEGDLLERGYGVVA